MTTTTSKLAWTHFLKASVMGFCLLPVGGAIVGLGQSWTAQSGYLQEPSEPLGFKLMNGLIMAGAWFAASAIPGSFFLGIPALLFGLLRLPLMGMLFKALRYYNWTGASFLALLGTAVIFELPVVLLAGLVPIQALYGNPVVRFCVVASLPWLIGSLWAMWSLRHELAAPVDARL